MIKVPLEYAFGCLKRALEVLHCNFADTEVLGLGELRLFNTGTLTPRQETCRMKNGGTEARTCPKRGVPRS